jgi:DNA polymerase-3 subunit alpha
MGVNSHTNYALRKNGQQEITPIHPELEAPLKEILEPTYGLIVYQEQVQRAAQILAGYTLGQADLLRRAMGKKKPEEMAKHRSIFVEGALRNQVAERDAGELFDLMEKFAGYGFNKSHAAAYALVAYQTAYCKVHHAAAFAAANLSVVMDVTEKVQDLVADGRNTGLTILAPDINVGVLRFLPVDVGTIQYGLGAVKGTGAAAIESIVESRRAGPFLGLADFCARMDKQRVNRRVIEALIRAGAFDRLDPDRARLIAALGRTLEDVERTAAHAGQESLFGGGKTALPALAQVPYTPWSERERLANERLALGFCFSGHLFTEYAGEARRLAPTRLADLKQARESVRIAGIVLSVRQQNTRRGRMCAVLIDDASGQLEVAVFAELYERRRQILKEDQLVFVTGRARFDEFSQRLALTADDVMDLAEARALSQASLTIEVEKGASAATLNEVLQAYRVNGGGNGAAAGGGPAPVARPGNTGTVAAPSAAGAPAPSCAGGGCRVVMRYVNQVAAADIVLPDLWRVRGEERLIEDLRAQANVHAAFQYA